VESLCSVDSSTKPQLSDGAERIGSCTADLKNAGCGEDLEEIHRYIRTYIHINTVYIYKLN